MPYFGQVRNRALVSCAPKGWATTGVRFCRRREEELIERPNELWQTVQAVVKSPAQTACACALLLCAAGAAALLLVVGITLIPHYMVRQTLTYVRQRRRRR